MDQTWVLIDGNTGLHVAWYFWLRVLDEVNRSARYGAPFGLLIVDCVTPPGSPAKLLDDAAGRVPAAVRGTDLAGIVSSGRIGIVLPHQDAAAAVAAQARIMDRLAASAPRGVRWESRLLCYPGDGAEISFLLTGADEGARSELQEQAELRA